MWAKVIVKAHCISSVRSNAAKVLGGNVREKGLGGRGARGARG